MRSFSPASYRLAESGAYALHVRASGSGAVEGSGHGEQRAKDPVLVAGEYGTRESRGLVLDLPFTHEELSFLIGVHRVSITRAMKELRSAGRIIQDKKRITLIS